jgi:hypothetical protein
MLADLFSDQPAQKLAAIGELNLLALRLTRLARTAGMTLASSAAPLNSERRDRSASGTRAVVSPQQLMGILRT